MNRVWIPLALLISNPSTPIASIEPDASTVHAVDAPIELRLAPYVDVLRTIDVRVGELETPFLFDTGGGSTVISLATAQAVGCTPFGRGTGFRHDGGRVDGRRGGPIDVSLGAFTRRGEVGVLDVDALLAGLPKVGGIASLETFAGHALTVDLGHDRVFVETPKSLEVRVRAGRELESRLARQAAGAALDMFVAIEGKHGPLWFEVDSGNVAPVLIAPHAFAELGLVAPTGDATANCELTIRGLGAVKCEVASKELIYDGLLNAEFCRRYALTFDLANGRTWAAPSR
ncbi:MAG: hypothetical protein K8S98_06865 [Planctomycetes bacterium]|nr:hypothetical protein [Planctomycetota bacterium]